MPVYCKVTVILKRGRRRRGKTKNQRIRRKTAFAKTTASLPQAQPQPLDFSLIFLLKQEWSLALAGTTSVWPNHAALMMEKRKENSGERERDVGCGWTARHGAVAVGRCASPSVSVITSARRRRCACAWEARADATCHQECRPDDYFVDHDFLLAIWFFERYFFPWEDTYGTKILCFFYIYIYITSVSAQSASWAASIIKPHSPHLLDSRKAPSILSFRYFWLCCGWIDSNIYQINIIHYQNIP